MAPVPVRLAVIGTSLTGGGAERFTSSFIGGLDPKVFDVALCLVRADITYPLPERVRVANLGKESRWSYLRTVKRLRRWLDEEKPEVVLSTIGFTGRLTGLALLGREDPPPWVARLGNVPMRAGFRPLGNLDRWLFRRGDCAVCNSVGLAEAVRHTYPYWRHKTYVLGTPMDFLAIDDLASQHLPPDLCTDAPVILSVGRLVPQKRLDVLLRAFRRVRFQETAQLWICGSGSLEKELRSWVKNNRLEDDVRFLGFQANPYSLMRRADVFALTSDFEGMPNALIEAQGLGVPVVATRCEFGPEEIVEDGNTGLLVDVDDSSATAAAILTLLRDRSLRRSMGRAAAVRARGKFGPDRLIGQWSDLLLRVSEQHRPGGNWR